MGINGYCLRQHSPLRRFGSGDSRDEIWQWTGSHRRTIACAVGTLRGIPWLENVRAASSARRPARSLVFVSADAAEGKTTVCSNLAISLAQIGKRVLVIDADMRHPSIHRSFNLANKAGLANYLANGGAWCELFSQPGSEDSIAWCVARSQQIRASFSCRTECRFSFVRR